MRSIGLLLIGFALATPLVWFLPLFVKHDPVAVFSQYIGCFALITMGITQLFATRMSWLETVFGGLDRIYVQHKWLGISAMVAVLLHDTIDAEMDGLGRETWLTDLAETLGELSLYGLLILVVITITTFIPYHLWKWTHKLMGTFFAFSAFHYFFMLKPFANGDPAGLYVSGFCLLGIVCYLYTLLPERTVRLRRKYNVQSVEQAGDALAVTLAPKGRGFTHRAGQFAFVSFDLPGLTEVHPYTISKAADDTKQLRFTIKPMGDHTHNLSRFLSTGTDAQVQGPFGHFVRPKRCGAQIWIAGGIGITPFVAWAQSLAKSPNSADQPVHLFYCVKQRTSAAHLSELEMIAGEQQHFHLHLIESSKKKRLSASLIKETVAADMSSATAAFCGPEAMRKTLKADLVRMGLPTGRFAYEEFEIRSGIGLWTLVEWIAPRLFNAIMPAVASKVR